MGREEARLLGLSPAGLSLVRAGVVAWSAIAVSLLLYAVWLGLRRVSIVVAAVAIAALIVAILDPLVSGLHRRGVPRWLGAAGVYVAVLFPVGFGLARFVELAIRQLEDLVEEGPAIVAEVQAAVQDFWQELAGVGVPLPAEDPAAWVAEHQDQIVEWVFLVLGAAGRIPGMVVALIFGIVVGFYLLVASPRVRAGFRALLPPTRREQILEGVRIVGRTITAFFRGQLLIAMLVGVLSIAGLLVLGIPFAVLLGTIAGLSNLVPFFGPIVGAIPGMVLGWAEGGPWLAVGVAVLFTAIQQFESYVLSPLILGATVRLRPIAVILSVMVGLLAAGVLGMLVAIPITASIKALYLRFAEPRAPPVATV